ncbi:MAG: hypothetical protein KJ077_04805 [Anaerolineae bacterium]|nr:hypothetical protein [Anaerolineae bacterium]
MTTQSNVSNPIEVAPARPFSWSLALAILALGLILGVTATNLVAAINKSDVAGVPQRVVRDFPARPNLLEVERKAHIAAQANIQRGREAEAARYTSLGLFYAAGSEARGQQATAAEAARYNGLAEFYGANVTSSPLDNALFAYHQSERGRIAVDSHTLAWPPRPAQFYPVQMAVVTLDTIGLSQYHQSEWGHMPQVSEANPDGDIGLMEFSTK